MADSDAQDKTIIARFYTTDGEATGPQMAIPLDITLEQLHTLLNEHILKNEDELPYSFFVHEEEIIANLFQTLQAVGKQDEEEVLKVVYQPQAIFRVRAVTRCTSSLPGHTEAILSVNFSPDGSKLASGSGDTTIRLWDTDTETPYKECKGHTNWVLCVKWAPNGTKLASGGMDKAVCLWDGETGKDEGTLRGHKNYITSLDWEPVHRNPNCTRMVSASKDGLAKVWDVTTKTCLFTLGGHSASITQVKWGGEGLIYTASQDRTIKVWSDKDGKLVRTLTGHGHWVNTLSLNTDYVLRTGSFDHTGKKIRRSR
jgi:ribosome assembly protein 4